MEKLARDVSRVLNSASMKRLVFLMALLPLCAHASNQDNLMIQDLTAADSAFAQVLSDAREGGALVDLKVSRDIGVIANLTIRLGARAKGVYQGEDKETKQIAQMTMFLSEFFNKATNAFAGFSNPELPGDFIPGRYDDKFFSNMSGYKEGTLKLREFVTARAAKVSEREFFERSLSAFAVSVGYYSKQVDNIAELGADVKKNAALICYMSGFLDNLLIQTEDDLKYLSYQNASLKPIVAAVSKAAHGSRYGATFCGQANDVSGITAGQNSETLQRALKADSKFFSDLNSQLSALK